MTKIRYIVLAIVNNYYNSQLDQCNGTQYHSIIIHHMMVHLNIWDVVMYLRNGFI
jgi:hypothetical protein